MNESSRYIIWLGVSNRNFTKNHEYRVVEGSSGGGPQAINNTGGYAVLKFIAKRNWRYADRDDAKLEHHSNVYNGTNWSQEKQVEENEIDKFVGRWIERVGCATTRLTRGKHYQLRASDTATVRLLITSDDGNSMCPKFKSANYWRILESHEEPSLADNPRIEISGEEITYVPTLIAEQETETVIKENPMKIEHQTLINGTNIDNLSNDDLVELIVNAEKKLDYLEAIEVRSEGITSMMDNVKDFISEVADILDKRV